MFELQISLPLLPTAEETPELKDGIERFMFGYGTPNFKPDWNKIYYEYNDTNECGMYVTRAAVTCIDIYKLLPEIYGYKDENNESYFYNVNICRPTAFINSNGNTLTMSAICPKCQEKAIQIQDKEKIEEAEKRGEIIIHAQDMEYDIGSILSSITYLKSEYTVKTDEGLIIYLRPNILKDKMKYGLMSYNQQKILKAYKDYDYEKRSTNDEAQSEIIENVTECYNKMNEIGNQLITSCISKIKLPDDTFVSDSQMIYEYVSNTKTSLIMKLHQKIKEMNDVGLPTTLSYRCSCCGHEWEDKFYGYNQVDFFGIGS